MNNTVFLTILTIILPLLGAGIGFLIKQNIEKNKELMSEITKTRRELYQQFIDLIIDVFSNTKTGKQQPEKEFLTKLYTFYKKYVLYASPDVINSFGDYFQYLYVQPSSGTVDVKIHFRKLTKIVAEMRKDLGLKNKHLGKDGVKLFRALISDYDSII